MSVVCIGFLRFDVWAGCLNVPLVWRGTYREFDTVWWGGILTYAHMIVRVIIFLNAVHYRLPACRICRLCDSRAHFDAIVAEIAEPRRKKQTVSAITESIYDELSVLHRRKSETWAADRLKLGERVIVIESVIIKNVFGVVFVFGDDIDVFGFVAAYGGECGDSCGGGCEFGDFGFTVFEGRLLGRALCEFDSIRCQVDFFTDGCGNRRLVESDNRVIVGCNANRRDRCCD